MGSFVHQLLMVAKIRHDKIGPYLYSLALMYQEKGVKVAILDLPGRIQDLPHRIPDLVGTIADLLCSIQDLKHPKSRMLPG